MHELAFWETPHLHCMYVYTLCVTLQSYACTERAHYITGDDEHGEIVKACSSRETGCYTLHQQGEQKMNELPLAKKIKYVTIT